MLWIALHLPLLSLESFEASLPRGASSCGLTHDPAQERSHEPTHVPAHAPASALLEAHHIHSANRAARGLGIKPGMKRATALALAPNIVLGQADPARDALALTAVAHAALAFTPQVVLPPAGSEGAAAHTVLLEVEASLRYFGGHEALLRRLLVAIFPLGHRIHTASTPTPHASALLARLHRHLHCADLAVTRSALEAAPVWLVGPGREHWEALQGMGLRTVGDLTCQPRSGLARRFGPVLLDELDRAFGIRPDPREPTLLPPVFESRLELFSLADTTEQLLHGAGVLLARMVVWLVARHAFVRRFSLVMRHEKRARSDTSTPARTTLDIALTEPSRDAAHLASLLRERLAHLPLPAPALELSLHAADIACRAPPNSELFPTRRSEREGLVRLIERLGARLGAEHIQRLVAVQDHRPEFATEVMTADGVSSTWQRPAGSQAPSRRLEPGDADAALRPVWLLAQPEPLRERAACPLLEGRPLQLLSGPERIESGWWDANLVERDYFIAQTAQGALVWVFRSRRPSADDACGWFLQGRFG